VLDTPSTESPHGRTLPTRPVTFWTSWYGSVGRIGALDLRLALHRVLWVEPLKSTIIKVRMQWLSIDCLDGSCLKLLFGWLIVRRSPQADLPLPFLFRTNQGKSPDRGIDAKPAFPHLVGSARPRALAGISPEDLGVAAGDHGLLDVRPVDEQLGHGPAISVSRNAANAHLLAHEHSVEVILRRHGWSWLGVLPLQLRGVDASQPDLFACGRGAGIAVVAALDGDSG
jgi:hypothetical protein